MAKVTITNVFDELSAVPERFGRNDTRVEYTITQEIDGRDVTRGPFHIDIPVEAFSEAEALRRIREVEKDRLQMVGKEHTL